MHEDILKFRKLCKVQRDDKKYSLMMIYQEIGISEPTLAKLLKDDEVKVSSIIGKVQDFIRKHINDLNYAGIKPNPEEVERLKNNLELPAGKQ